MHVSLEQDETAQNQEKNRTGVCQFSTAFHPLPSDADGFFLSFLYQTHHISGVVWCLLDRFPQPHRVIFKLKSRFGVLNIPGAEEEKKEGG